MSFILRIVSSVLMGSLLLLVSGCKEGAFEKAGEKVDKAVEETGNALEKGGEKVENAIEDAKDRK